jgi:hypothetical protein
MGRLSQIGQPRVLAIQPTAMAVHCLRQLMLDGQLGVFYRISLFDFSLTCYRLAHHLRVRQFQSAIQSFHSLPCAFFAVVTTALSI